MSVIRVEKHMTRQELANKYPMMWVTMYNMVYDMSTLEILEADIFEVGDYEEATNGYDRLGELRKYHPTEVATLDHTCPDKMEEWGRPIVRVQYTNEASR